MAILRWASLVVVMVAMGLSTVSWKTQTLAAGYEAARGQRRLSQLIEEERVETARLARLTAPAQVANRAKEIGLAPAVRSGGAALAWLNVSAGAGRSLALAGPDERQKVPR